MTANETHRLTATKLDLRRIEVELGLEHADTFRRKPWNALIDNGTLRLQTGVFNRLLRGS